MKLYQKCDITYINNVLYNENFITSIISMKEKTAEFCVTIDLEEELALLVHIPNKIVKFKQLSNSLYAMDPFRKESYVLTKE